MGFFYLILAQVVPGKFQGCLHSLPSLSGLHAQLFTDLRGVVAFFGQTDDVRVHRVCVISSLEKLIPQHIGLGFQRGNTNVNLHGVIGEHTVELLLTQRDPILIGQGAFGAGVAQGADLAVDDATRKLLMVGNIAVLVKVPLNLDAENTQLGFGILRRYLCEGNKVRATIGFAKGAHITRIHTLSNIAFAVAYDKGVT